MFCYRDDIIDSRDIIERINELKSEKDGLDGEELIEWEEDNDEELSSLLALQEECKDCTSDWSYGEVLIHNAYFPEYAKQLCEDIGDIPYDLPSYIVLDWDATADNLREGYTEVDFDGERYLIRCT